MFTFESYFLFFFTLSILMVTAILFKVVQGSFAFTKVYLLGIALTAIVNPSFFYFFDYIHKVVYGTSINLKYVDLFFAGDFLFLLLLGGLISTRSINNLKKHISLSLFATIILTFSLLVSNSGPVAPFSHKIISLSLVILLISMCFESLSSLKGLPYGQSLMFNVLFCSIAGVTLWLVVLFIMISFNSTWNIPNQLSEYILNFWLILKSLLIFICFCFLDFIDEEDKQVFSKMLIKNANKRTEQMRLACISLFKLPYPVFITSLEGNIEFSNKESIKLLGTGDLDGRNINNVFLTIEPSSSSTSIASIKLTDKSLKMFDIRYYYVDINKTNKKVCCIEPIEFDFSAFCHGIISKVSNSPDKVLGILDHNFAIYRMSSGWTELLNPVDKFFHSGLIWDKLKILSKDQREIGHFENSIASESESTAWLNLRSGSSVKVRLLKLYAPDFRHFYLFSADIVENNLNSNKISDYLVGQKLKTI